MLIFERLPYFGMLDQSKRLDLPLASTALVLLASSRPIPFAYSDGLFQWKIDIYIGL